MYFSYGVGAIILVLSLLEHTYPHSLTFSSKSTLVISNGFPSLPLWQIWTISFVETSLAKLLVLISLIIGSTVPLEALWSRRELGLYIAFSSGVSGALFIITRLVVYYLFKNESFYVPVSGTIGCVISLLIGFRHAFPYQEIMNLNKILPSPFHGILPARGVVQARHLPFLCLSIELACSVVSPSLFREWPLALFSFFVSWFYIRYLMYFPYANLRGDHSSEFVISLLFPKLMRPFVDRVGAVVYAAASRITPRLMLRSVGRITVGPALYFPTDLATATAVVSSRASIRSPSLVSVVEERRAKVMHRLSESIGRTEVHKPEFSAEEFALV